MKKFIYLICLAMMLAGCTGINTSVVTNTATDIAFVEILKHNASHKAQTVQALQNVRAFLGQDGITYDQLIARISAELPGEYAYISVILINYFEADRPVFETYAPLLASYKQAATDRINHWLVLANMVQAQASLGPAVTIGCEALCRDELGLYRISCLSACKTDIELGLR